MALSSIHGTTTLSASSSAGDAADTTDALMTTTAILGATGSSSTRTTDVSGDMPLDHRLPSPEEQCHLIALRYVSF